MRKAKAIDAQAIINYFMQAIPGIMKRSKLVL
jgi:hypothetical protein